MAEKRRGLGRGLGALIPNGSGAERPVDVFFPGAPSSGSTVQATESGPPATSATTSEGAETTDGRPATDVPRGTEGDQHDDLVGAPAVSRGTSGAGTPESTEGTPDSARQTPGAASDDARGDTATQGSGAPVPRETSQGSGTGELLPVPGAYFAELPVSSIIPNPRQPRTVFDEEALEELASSIREIGVLQPVVVRQTSADGEAQFELIMGERRWRATQEAGLDTIPAIVRETDDEDLLRDALLENLHRSQLNALEEAAAYQQLLDDFSCTHEELARRIHRSRPQISNTLRLLKLPPLVQRRVAAGVLSAGHARALLGLPDAGAMERLAQRIVAEGLSVRATEEIVTLGGDQEKRAVRRPRAGDRNGAMDDLASRLSDRFETRVKVQLGRTKGKLTVEFASVQDLNRILSTLSPDDPGLLR